MNLHATYQMSGHLSPTRVEFATESAAISDAVRNLSRPFERGGTKGLHE